MVGDSGGGFTRGIKSERTRPEGRNPHFTSPTPLFLYSSAPTLGVSPLQENGKGLNSEAGEGGEGRVVEWRSAGGPNPGGLDPLSGHKEAIARIEG